MPAPTDLKLLAKPVAAKLAPADLAWLREATPPRRLVAGGKRILLTSEPTPAAGGADVVLHPSARPYAKLVDGKLDVGTGRADDAPDGESPCVLYDAATGEAKVRFAAWDRTVLRRRAG
jgi:hypothetical protein